MRLFAGFRVDKYRGFEHKTTERPVREFFITNNKLTMIKYQKILAMQEKTQSVNNKIVGLIGKYGKYAFCEDCDGLQSKEFLSDENSYYALERHSIMDFVTQSFMFYIVI
jgi:hypothetical protein